MINIVDKKDCCGCSACAVRCPKQCIELEEDTEGFLYPQVDKGACINCGVCEEVCPVLHPAVARNPLAVYAAQNKNEGIRMKSSSGGVFAVLATRVIENGGVVFGAKFDGNWEVVHDCVEKREEIIAFQGSKYVQSRLGDCFKQAEQFLKSGQQVLFSGTPCQIAGLKHFLRKEYDNLLAVDFICHGVPSPRVWREYLEEEIKRHKIKGVCHISFRDKSLGWRKYSLRVDGDKGAWMESRYRNPYLKAFLCNLILRPSCHACPAKDFKSQSDITIADFWAVDKFLPSVNDGKGCSLVFVHDPKIEISFFKQQMNVFTLDVHAVCEENAVIHWSAKEHKNRTVFFEKLGEKNNIRLLLEKYATVSWKKRLRLFLAEYLRN